VVERWRGRSGKPRPIGEKPAEDTRQPALARSATIAPAVAATPTTAAAGTNGLTRSQSIQAAEAAFGSGRAGSVAALARARLRFHERCANPGHTG
jgi:hypothetical protein